MISMPGHCRCTYALQQVPYAAPPSDHPGIVVRFQVEQICIDDLPYDGQLNAVRRHLRGHRRHKQE